MADDNIVYSTKKYWDERFENEEHYEWLAEFDDIKDSLLPILQQRSESKILIIGNGTSQLPVELESALDNTKIEIVASDISSVAVDKMRERFEKHSNVKWVVGDITNFKEYDDHTFDFILDKGTMDALLASNTSPWNIQKHTIDICENACYELSRIMTIGGQYIQITFEQPHFRRRILRGMRCEPEVILSKPSYETIPSSDTEYGWELTMKKLDVAKTLDIFMWIAEKKG